MIKRLFVLQTPEVLPSGEAEKLVVDVEKVMKDCGLDARVIVLDGPYTLSEIEDKELDEDGGGE